jgi:hypothetical protein
MPRDGKKCALSKKVCTIIAIDALHGLSGGTEFNIPQYAAFIDILKIQTTISNRTFTGR